MQDDGASIGYIFDWIAKFRNELANNSIFFACSG